MTRGPWRPRKHTTPPDLDCPQGTPAQAKKNASEKCREPALAVAERMMQAGLLFGGCSHGAVVAVRWAQSVLSSLPCICWQLQPDMLVEQQRELAALASSIRSKVAMHALHRMQSCASCLLTSFLPANDRRPTWFGRSRTAMAKLKTWSPLQPALRGYRLSCLATGQVPDYMKRGQRS